MTRRRSSPSPTPGNPTPGNPQGRASQASAWRGDARPFSSSQGTSCQHGSHSWRAGTTLLHRLSPGWTVGAARCMGLRSALEPPSSLGLDGEGPHWPPPPGSLLPASHGQGTVAAGRLSPDFSRISQVKQGGSPPLSLIFLNFASVLAQFGMPAPARDGVPTGGRQDRIFTFTQKHNGKDIIA